MVRDRSQASAAVEAWLVAWEGETRRGRVFTLAARANRFGMPLATADALLLLPEGMIALVAPPFGLLMDRRRWSLTKRLYWSAASLTPIPVALLLLAWLGPAVGPNVTTLAVGNSPPPAAPNLLAPALAPAGER